MYVRVRGATNHPQASGFSEKEAKDLDAFVAKEGWGGDDADGEEEESEGEDEQEELDGCDASHAPESNETTADGTTGTGEEESGSEEGSSSGGNGSGGEGEENEGARIRRVKAPETVTKRAHAAVQRQRRAAGAGGASKPTRNHQKRKEKGKMLYKHRDF